MLVCVCVGGGVHAVFVCVRVWCVQAVCVWCVVCVCVCVCVGGGVHALFVCVHLCVVCTPVCVCGRGVHAVCVSRVWGGVCRVCTPC